MFYAENVKANDEAIEKMKSIFGSRIYGKGLFGEPDVGHKWIIWHAAAWTGNLTSLVEEAKAAGVVGVWARKNKVGCLAHWIKD